LTRGDETWEGVIYLYQTFARAVPWEHTETLEKNLSVSGSPLKDPGTICDTFSSTFDVRELLRDQVIFYLEDIDAADVSFCSGLIHPTISPAHNTTIP
jgi:hypothetical protein